MPNPNPTRVKICGLTRPEDAEAAVRHGAAWLGVVFAGGPRRLTAERAAGIVEAAGQVPVLGVFGSQGREEILRTRDAAGLAGAQLHGGASPELVSDLRREGMTVVVVARLAASAELPELDPFMVLDVPILVEPRVADHLGGSGTPLALEIARAARDRLRACQMFLAGGLTPETVARAVGSVRPDAVDVSSGVEQIPGIKDHNKLARFLEAVRWA